MFSKLANLLIEISDSLKSSSQFGNEIMEKVEFNLMIKTSCQPGKSCEEIVGHL